MRGLFGDAEEPAAIVGDVLGAFEDTKVGTIDGLQLRISEGLKLGVMVLVDGMELGLIDGLQLGVIEGVSDGVAEGIQVGLIEGTLEGAKLGDTVGMVGAKVGVNVFSLLGADVGSRLTVGDIDGDKQVIPTLLINTSPFMALTDIYE